MPRTSIRRTLYGGLAAERSLGETLTRWPQLWPKFPHLDILKELRLELSYDSRVCLELEMFETVSNFLSLDTQWSKSKFGTTIVIDEMQQQVQRPALMIQTPKADGKVGTGVVKNLLRNRTRHDLRLMAESSWAVLKGVSSQVEFLVLWSPADRVAFLPDDLVRLGRADI